MCIWEGGGGRGKGDGKKLENIERWDKKNELAAGRKRKEATRMEINAKTKGTKDTRERNKQSGNGKDGSTKERGGEKKSAVICPRE